jgi:hypothetical protein
VIVLAVLSAAPAHAQRTAISANLSPEAAAEAFQQAVTDVCVPAVAGSGVSALAAAHEGRVQPTQDAETRRQAGATADETVWDVVAAQGVVTVREKAGRCVVAVYGPPRASTMSGASDRLSGAGFELLAAAAGEGVRETLIGSVGDKRVMVQLLGVAPGMPDNRSKFSVVTATVFAVQ